MGDVMSVNAPNMDLLIHMINSMGVIYNMHDYR